MDGSTGLGEPDNSDSQVGEYPDYEIAGAIRIVGGGLESVTIWDKRLGTFQRFIPDPKCQPSN